MLQLNDTPTEVAIRPQTLQLNVHQQSDQSPILQHFHMNCYQTQLQRTDTGTSQRKQTEE
jgi:hypothetical protein